MQTAIVVLETVLAVLAVMGLGALLRRRAVLDDHAGASMSRLVADVTFPALCLDGLGHADARALSAGVPVVVLGFVTLAVAALVGLVLVRLTGVADASRPTAVFAIAIGNWIFLPLPIADALFGARGTTTVVLNNVGAQVFLWTLGLGLLRGRLDPGAARMIVRSPGLWATLAGVVCALAPAGVPAPLGAALGVLGEAVHLVGTLTIPLVSIAIGVQLAAPAVGPVPTRALAAVVIGRMLLAPFAVAALVAVVIRAGVVLDPDVVTVEHLIAAMPVSLSAAALVQRYEGDVPLISRAILVTTVLAAVVAPLWMLALDG